MKKLHYKNYIFDLDSTLTTIEGIDELGAQKGVREEITRLTNLAMGGEGNLANIFLTRLKLIRPTRTDILELGELYAHHVTPGAREIIRQLQKRGGNVFVVSGGYKEAVEYYAQTLHIPSAHVFSNRLEFTEQGEFLGLDESVPLWKNHGKAVVVRQIQAKYPGRTLCIGDGISDYEASLEADGFVYFGGVAYRERVAQLCECVVRENDLRLIEPFI